jgi:NAD(P)-dependent dehydrogenase (short-subunit alcohol dehydrogenase family)
MTGRLVIVTADDEQGRALAQALAAEGAGVVLATSDPATSGRLASELGGTGARLAIFCPGPDLSADVDAIVELAAEVGARG